MSIPLQMPVAKRRATIDDLMRVEGKAELINGEVVPLTASGSLPASVAFNVAMSLHAYAKSHGGEAYADGIIFAVDELPSGRESFAPDAAYHTGALPANGMDAIPAAPTFAVEVRSKNDYGPAADRDYAAKRADYFAAGTLAVWDVDPVARTVTCYHPAAPAAGVTFAEPDEADAGPAVPGWRVPVADVFAV